MASTASARSYVLSLSACRPHLPSQLVCRFNPTLSGGSDLMRGPQGYRRPHLSHRDRLLRSHLTTILARRHHARPSLPHLCGEGELLTAIYPYSSLSQSSYRLLGLPHFTIVIARSSSHTPWTQNALPQIPPVYLARTPL